MRRMEFMKGDITLLEVDAIVNAANSQLAGGGGVDGAIHRRGGPTILEECRLIRDNQGGCPPGEAVITSAGLLKARFVIHAVGPIWRGGGRGEDKLLENAYRNSLALACAYNLTTIAFPNISTGVYGFPKDRAAQIATKAVAEFMEANQMPDRLIFCCFDDENYKLYSNILNPS